jgi:primosomal protein N' (replication factor Y)
MLTRSVKAASAPAFAEIALPLPLRQNFTYKIPDDIATDIHLGARVLVPFGKRRITGYVVDLHNEEPTSGEIREIKSISTLLDTQALLTPDVFGLTKWTADYYLASWGELLKAALPPGINASTDARYAITDMGRSALLGGLRVSAAMRLVLEALSSAGELTAKEIAKRTGLKSVTQKLNSLLETGAVSILREPSTPAVTAKRRKAVRLIAEAEALEKEKLTAAQSAVVATLTEHDGELLFTDVLEKSGVSGSAINSLAKKGFLDVYVRDVRRDPLEGESVLPPLALVMTANQQQAFDQIQNAITSRQYKAFLLHGVTGSGKTEVYMQAMRSALELGRSSMMLVPEISLTPIFSRQLRSTFGSEVAILHSSLSSGERFDEWQRIRSGSARIVIGTRSAVFAPLENLGLIIIDEEHDSSYRQHESPYYNARDVAVMRANTGSATVVLGSATPAVETFYNAHAGKYEYLRLPGRIADRPMAEAEVVDMREVFRDAGKDVTFSPRLLNEIDAAAKRGEQSIVLLNRRGFSQFVLCRSCGESLKCRNCDITMTYHKRESRLICHYCDHKAPVPDDCPFCDSEFLYFIGEGTEQAETMLRKHFPDLRIERVDRDTISRKQNLDKILLRFSRHEIDMLIGTQMLAKGHDFPNVTLVGVISVDIGLGLPDLRSAERTFQLLTQVAGRAGRGDRPGRVLIQTYYPDHYAVRHAQNQDYEGFYKEEIRYRERLGYPPFTVLASLLIRHADLGHLQKTADLLRRSLDSANNEKQMRITGPAPAPLSRLKGLHRVQIILRSASRSGLKLTLNTGLHDAEKRGCDLRIVQVEIDPISMM